MGSLHSCLCNPARVTSSPPPLHLLSTFSGFIPSLCCLHGRRLFRFAFTHILCSPRQWSRMKYAGVCAQALSSHCPVSRHQEGWHSHPRSSVRTWRPLATGDRIRNQGWGPTSLPIPTARDAWLLLPTVIPSLRVKLVGIPSRDQAGKTESPLSLSVPLLMARGLPSPLVFLYSEQGMDIRKLA